MVKVTNNNRNKERPALNHATEDVEVGGIKFRKGRGGFDSSQNKTLAINEELLSNELDYRWVNDENSNIERHRGMGYEAVSPKMLSDGEETSTVRRVGNKKDGSPLNAFLMATPKAWRSERKNKLQSNILNAEQQIKDGKHDDLDGSFYKKQISIKT